MNSSSSRATVHEPKKNSGYRESIGDLFCGFTLNSREDFVFSSTVGNALRTLKSSLLCK